MLLVLMIICFEKHVFLRHLDAVKFHLKLQQLVMVKQNDTDMRRIISYGNMIYEDCVESVKK